MNQSTLEKVYGIMLAIIFGGIVMHAPFSVWLGSLLPEYALLIKSWKEILLLLLVPIAVIIVTRRKLWAEFRRDWLFHIIVAYTLVHLLIVGLLYQGAAATAAGMAIDLRYVLFFGLVYVLIKIAPQRRRLFLQIGIVGACIVVGFATLQLFLPPDILRHIGYNQSTIAPFLTVDQNPDYVRVNSTLRGPNPLGAYATVVLALLSAALVTGRLRQLTRTNGVLVGLLTLCSLVAVWISYSRSALVAAIIAVGLVVLLYYGRRIHRAVWVGIVAATLLLGAGVYLARDTSFVSHVIMHEDPNEGNDVNSNDGHVESLIDGLDRMSAQPLGAGVGSTGSASLQGDMPVIIENQYLFVAHETGWLGLLLFTALYTAVLLRLWHTRRDWLSLGVLTSGVGLALIGLLLPVWVDDTVAIVWWGLAAIALASQQVVTIQTNKRNEKLND